MNCLDHETSIKCEKNVTLKTSQSQVALVYLKFKKIGKKKENLLLLFTKSVKRTKKEQQAKTESRQAHAIQTPNATQPLFI